MPTWWDPSAIVTAVYLGLGQAMIVRMAFLSWETATFISNRSSSKPCISQKTDKMPLRTVFMIKMVFPPTGRKITAPHSFFPEGEEELGVTFWIMKRARGESFKHLSTAVSVWLKCKACCGYVQAKMQQHLETFSLLVLTSLLLNSFQQMGLCAHYLLICAYFINVCSRKSQLHWESAKALLLDRHTLEKSGMMQTRIYI